MVEKRNIVKYFLLAISSGLSGFFFITTINKLISKTVGQNYLHTQNYVITLITVIIFTIGSKRALSLLTVKLSQNLIWTIRKDILKSVLKASYQELLNKKENIELAIVVDVNILSQAAANLIDFLIAFIVTFSCFVYLTTISLPIFFIALLVTIIGAMSYHLSAKRNIAKLKQAHELERKFLEKYKNIIDGFKEIYIDPRKGEFIFLKRINEIANETIKNNTEAFTSLLNNQMTGKVLFLFLVPCVILYSGKLLAISPGTAISIAFTLIYLLNYIETLTILFPSLIKARLASNHLINLKSQLTENSYGNRPTSNHFLKNDFKSLQIRELVHYHLSGQKFTIGPINFDLNKGEIVFIYGGNGSGKTTFINNVLGLYIPNNGSIKFNETLVTSENYPEYKTLYSVVFNDYYLFDEIVSTQLVNKEKSDFYLKLFEIDHKVSIENNRFTTTNLSTGERKRLALAVALLEERPILVIDEWAADQDPCFRKKFYMEILNVLKKEGVSIIAITHDDKYYSCADRIYKMEYGNLVSANNFNN